MLQSERVVRAGFRLASHIAPMHAGRAAFQLFCSPMRSKSLSASERRLVSAMRPVMAVAEQSTIAHPGGAVRAYRWRHLGERLRGRVLLLHGWTGQSLVMTAFVQPLLEQGIEVIAFDLPAHGQSSGKRLILPEASQAMQAVTAHYGALTGVVTHSLGGPVALLAMEGGAPLVCRLDVPRIVMIAAPNWLDRVTTMFGDRIGLSAQARASFEDEILRVARRPVAQFRSDQLLRCAGASALVIHDEDDEYVEFDSATAIVAGNPKARLLATSGLGHRRIIADRGVVEAATGFLAAA